MDQLSTSEIALEKDSFLSESLVCLHCGAPTQGISIANASEKLLFCCQGCRTAFELIADLQNESCPLPERKEGRAISEVYASLDQSAVALRLPIVRHADGIASISFHIPSMSCAACVRHLNALHTHVKGIERCAVDFPTKSLSVWYNPDGISIGWVAQTLAWEGYPPDLSALATKGGDASSQASDNASRYQKANRQTIGRLVVAGFAAGNTMMLSFPQYLGLTGHELSVYGPLLERLTIGLSALVLVYAAGPWFKAAYQSLAKGRLSVDFPIALAILTLFLRSIYDIWMGTSPGFLDSMCGLVFLLLIGKWLQGRYYQKLEFEHEYRSFFPLTFKRRAAIGAWETALFTDLRKGDSIRLRASEIIPADGVVIEETDARVETSFLTGESDWRKVQPGTELKAGSRVMQGLIQLQLQHSPETSYMSRLWNESAEHGEISKAAPSRFEDLFVKYFTAITLIIAGVTFAFWQWQDASRALEATTAVLMVACPCALTLAMPFASSQAVTLLSYAGLHLKNAKVLERLAHVDYLVFDKTGTLTQDENTPSSLVWHDAQDRTAAPMPQRVADWLRMAAAHSYHPLLQQVLGILGEAEFSQVTDFQEIKGQGVQFDSIEGLVKIGQFGFVESRLNKEVSGSVLAVSLNGRCIGYCTLHQSIRPGVEAMLADWDVPVMVLTGDHDGGATYLKAALASGPAAKIPAKIRTRQTPDSKRNWVTSLQEAGYSVLMLGDGANDSPAMKEASVSMAVVNERNSFFPSADAILKGQDLHLLKSWVDFSQGMLKAVKISLVFSLVYNVIGLSWAISGQLKPWLAALFMPLSSLSVVALAVLLTRLYAKQTLFPHNANR